jgi:predicted aldo/keto reductase-like oxidoreductase
MKPFGGGLLDQANLSIKYLLQFDGVVPDPGIETLDEMAEIVDIVEGSWEMTDAERAELERVREKVGTRFCRRCQYCMPCEQGVQISTVMNAKSFWKRFPEDRFTGGWVAQAIKSAESCIECGECEEKCPYHLAIIDMLAENVAFFKRVTA